MGRDLVRDVLGGRAASLVSSHDRPSLPGSKAALRRLGLQTKRRDKKNP